MSTIFPFEFELQQILPLPNMDSEMYYELKILGDGGEMSTIFPLEFEPQQILPLPNMVLEMYYEIKLLCEEGGWEGKESNHMHPRRKGWSSK